MKEYLQMLSVWFRPLQFTWLTSIPLKPFLSLDKCLRPSMKFSSQVTWRHVASAFDISLRLPSVVIIHLSISRS